MLGEDEGPASPANGRRPDPHPPAFGLPSENALTGQWSSIVIQREAAPGTPTQETSEVRSTAAPAEQTEQFVQSGNGVERRERVVSDGAGSEHREQSVRDVGSEHQQQLLRILQFVRLLIGIVEALIGARVVLRFIAANPDNAVAHFVYGTSAVLLAPFFGLTGSPAAGGSVLEIPSLIAMAVYGFAGWGLVQVAWMLFGRAMTRSTSTYDRSRA
jgi:hypothetical protein